jgi:hypothetical protein
LFSLLESAARASFLESSARPDGPRLLYAVMNDPVMLLVELPGGKELATFESDGSGSFGAAFSPDGLFAVAADTAGVVHLWRLPDPPALGKKK